MKQLHISLLLFALVAISGCSFDAAELEGRECSVNDPNGCGDGQVCMQGYCVEGVDVLVDADVPSADTGDAVTDVPEEVFVPELCGGVECQSGEECCDDGTGERCVLTIADLSNCGSCGNACGTDQLCVGGICSCPVGSQICDGSNCVDILSDVNACGSCDNTCGVGLECDDGLCICGNAICNDGDICCDVGGSPSCFNPDTSLDHCGACGVACGEGEVCEDGECKCGDIVEVDSLTAACDTSEQLCCAGACVAPGSPECACGNQPNCASGELCCNDNCTAVRTDVSNCGACGVVCLGDEVCTNGSCGCPSDTPNSCSGNTCVDLITDTNNCGTCGNVCGGGETCCNGSCVNTDTSELHCGACIATGGVRCGNTQECCTGTCEDILTDVGNCGSCGNDCNTHRGVQGSGNTCQSGACNYNCSNFRDDCSPGIDGCETNTRFNNNNCGACRVACNGATDTCCEGSCVDTLADDNHCGGCSASGGVVCSSEPCTGGSCGCSGGFADCDGNTSNGCETNTNTSTTHCGACDAGCSSGQLCCNGGCVDPDSDDTNCGSCGNDCTDSSQVCCTGACRTLGTSTDCDACGDVCSTGDCCNDACTPINTTSNCLGCGVTCQAGEDCCGSGCTLLGTTSNCASCGDTCISGEGCCNDACAALNTTANCLTCGNACTSGQACCGSGCTDLGTTSNCATCGDSCGTGQDCCSGGCVDLGTNSHCSACGDSCASGSACIAGACIPDNPTNVDASDGDSGSVTITFTHPSAATECLVMRSINGFPRTHTDGTEVSKTTSGGSKTVTDSTVTDGVTYYYAVFCAIGTTWNDELTEGNADSGRPGTGIIKAPDWWDCDYGEREQAVVSAAAVKGITGGYSLSITFDHAQLVSDGNALANGNDLRVAYFNGTVWAEVDRVLDPTSAWNQSDTTLWFAIQTGFALGGSAGYWIYYDNSGAGSPPADEDAVFHSADFFERANNEAVGNGWTITTGAGDVDILNGQLYFETTDDIANRPIADRSFTAITTGGFAFRFGHNWDRTAGENTYRIQSAVGNAMSTATGTGFFRTDVGPHIIWAGPNQGMVDHEGLGYAVNAAVTQLQVASGATDVEVQGSLASDTYDYLIDGSVVASDVPFSTALTQIDKMRFMTWNVSQGGFSNANSRGWDYAIVRLLVSPEPVTLLDAQETRPGTCP